MIYRRNAIYTTLPTNQIIRWQSAGSVVATHKRPFHNWAVYGGSPNSVFVWQNAGTSTPAAGGSRHRVIGGGWGQRVIGM